MSHSIPNNMYTCKVGAKEHHPINSEIDEKHTCFKFHNAKIRKFMIASNTLTQDLALDRRLYNHSELKLDEKSAIISQATRPVSLHDTMSR